MKSIAKSCYQTETIKTNTGKHGFGELKSSMSTNETKMADHTHTYNKIHENRPKAGNYVKCRHESHVIKRKTRYTEPTQKYCGFQELRRPESTLSVHDCEKTW